jgi:RimJ/RimL family protein N-acetyltransferase
VTPRTLKTARVALRQWIESDHEPFAAMSADPEVMRYFVAPLSRGESEALIGRVSTHIAEHGWGLWAVEHNESGKFMGFIGLHPIREGLPCAGELEAGWRLASEFWGQGYATEAAGAALRFGFEELGREQIAALTAVLNKPSQAVMDRLGMTLQGSGFQHPFITEGHPIRPHLLYRITLEEWLAWQGP